jgi:hypothetical protein
MTSLILGYAAILTPALIVLVGCAVAGYLMLARVDRGLAGVLLGFFLGPVGLLIAWPMRANALLDRQERRDRDRDLARAVPVSAAPTPVAAARPAAPVAPARSVTFELDALIAQRARGQISADEYERRKAELLG